MKHARLFLWAIALFFTASAYADWTQDITYPALGPTDLPEIRTLERGALVTDLISTAAWPGKEVIQASHDRIYIFHGDNSGTPLELTIPELLSVVPQGYAQTRLWIEDQPAIGDVNDDGYLDIVAAITTYQFFNLEVPFSDYRYSAVVWWTWNPQTAAFDRHHYYNNGGSYTSSRDAFLTPTICRTLWQNGAPSVVFYGRTYHHTLPAGREWRLVAFDLRDPQNIVRSPNRSWSDNLTYERFGEKEEYVVAAADLDQDGFDELVLQTPQELSCYDWNGTQWSEQFDYWIQDYDPSYRIPSGGITIGDIDADFDLEILIAVVDSTLGAYENVRMLRISNTGTLEQVYGANDDPENQYDTWHPVPALAGVSQWIDGEQASRAYPFLLNVRDGRMYFNNGSMFPALWHYPFDFQPNLNFDQHLGVAFADAYGLDRPQIIFSGNDLGGATSCKLYDFLNVEAPLEQVEIPDLPDWSISVDVRNRAVPAIDDIDGDGLTEMVYVVNHPVLNTKNNNFKVFTRDTQVPYSRELVYWSQFQNGPAHKGLYAQPVSGTQPRAGITWEGRITVHENYVVEVGQVLTIKPGTVIEFRPYAYLDVYGTLIAEGTEYDSIYFKPDGVTNWSGIFFWTPDAVNMQYCVIHDADAIGFDGGESNVFVHNHLYNMNFGLDIFLQTRDGFLCQDNLITDCFYNGIRGFISAGRFVGNTIRECTRSGIYWYGDNDNPAESPYFERNLVEYNGSGANKIGGAYFNYTTAELACNSFNYNDPNQVILENYADVVMNGDYQYSAYNTLTNGTTTAWCGCTAPCVCPSPPAGFKPLLKIRNSLPQLNYGYNSFLVTEGTFAEDPCPRGGAVHEMKANYYAANGTPHPGPTPGDPYFCRPEHFDDPFPTEGLTCLAGLEAALGGSEAAFSQAASSENESEYSLAAIEYSNILHDYPMTLEAQWALRGFQHSLVSGGSTANATADSLFEYFLNESNPSALREAARHEAVWALMAGHVFGEARDELSAIALAPPTEDDSLWAVIADAAIDVMENGPSIQSVGPHRQQTRVKLISFHDKLHTLMGRVPDSDIQRTSPAAEQMTLATAYPNPFNNSVTIQLQLNESGPLKLCIFNLLGQEVETLADKTLEVGTHRFNWNGANTPSGVYFYRIEQNAHIQSHKLMLLK